MLKPPKCADETEISDFLFPFPRQQFSIYSPFSDWHHSIFFSPFQTSVFKKLKGYFSSFIYIYIYFSIFIHHTHSFSRLKKKNYSSLDSFTLLHSIFFSIFEKRTKLWIILCDEFISIVEILLDNAPRPSIPAESSWGRVVGKWWWRISRHVLGIELFLPNAFKPAALPELII